MKLTTEQLLFAHRIGATHHLIEGIVERDGNTAYFWRKEGYVWTWVDGWDSDSCDSDKLCIIDFTPLYDWIDHDGGECPVNPDATIDAGYKNDACIVTDKAGVFIWEEVERFKLHRDSDWPEQRADAIGQNGNTGEHYPSKYHREITPGVWVDVYDVLKAWNVENPALQHLIKKALQPSERGHKTLKQDMDDIIASAIRAKALSQ